MRTLKEFIDRESEFLTTASETISSGLKESLKEERNRPQAGSSFVTRDSHLIRRNQIRCPRCVMGNMEFGLVTALKE